MTGKGQLIDNDNKDSSAKVKLIADKRRLLEENANQVREEIKNCFENLIDLLKTRRERLLRQVEAIHCQQLSLIYSESEIPPSEPLSFIDTDGRDKVEESILHFGRVELVGSNCITAKDAEPYKVEEYQEADKDHVSFSKSIVCEHERDRISLELSNLPINSGIEGSGCRSKLANGIDSTDTRSTPSKVPTLCDETTKTILPEEEESLCCYKDSPSSKGSESRSDIVLDSEHPKQVQQWLQQILVETETEPTIHESGHLSELSKARISTENVEYTLSIQ